MLLYAGVAGFRTVADPDLPWQLRDAQYLLETGSIARQDVFSYTAAGRPWMYPQGAGLIFYGLYRLGGYAALSWLGLAACAGATLALLAIRPGIWAAAATALAIPLIAWRTAVRADLFTTLLFAVYLAVLLRGAHRRVWLLPLLMVAWVNLHPGFLLGLGLIALFLASAWITKNPVRPLALTGGLTLLATLVNPFGVFVWKIPWRQAQETALYRSVVNEWWPSPWSWWRLAELLEWRDPDGAYWVLLFFGAAVAALAAWKRQWLLAALIVVFSALSLSSIRFQALLAIVVAASTAVITRGFPSPSERRRARSCELAVTAALLLLAGVRIFDLVTNRYYFSRPLDSIFGSGLSYAFPERAADFVLHERLPGRLLHEYGLGGYLSWKLGRGYPIFIDGRTIPFAPDILLEHRNGLQAAPGSPQWRAFLDRWGIQTIVAGLERHRGYGLPLRRMCDSPDLALVYLDEVSAVFVRNVPANRPWVERLGRGCAEVTLSAAPAAHGFVAGVPPYIFRAHLARLYYQLGRYREAAAEVNRARRYFRGDPELHILAGRILLAAGEREPDSGQPDSGQRARAEFLAATTLGENSRAWFSLGMLESAAGRHEEAIRAYRRSTRTATLPYEAYRSIGEGYLALKQPRQALAWFGKALEARGSPAARQILGPNFLAAAHAGEARTRFMMGDIGAAEQALHAAAAADPHDPSVRLMQAEFYLGQARFAEARQSLERARALGAAGPMVTELEKRLERSKK